MNTIWHLFWPYALLRTRKVSTLFFALVGALLPDTVRLIDLVLVFLTKGFSYGVLMSTPERPIAHILSSYLHSLVVIGIVAVIVLFFRVKMIYPGLFGWGLHIFLDSFTHKGESYYYLYPFSSHSLDWGVSYYQPQLHAVSFEIVHVLLVAFVLLFFIFRSKEPVSPWFDGLVISGFILYELVTIAFYFNSPGFIVFVLSNLFATFLFFCYLLRHFFRRWWSNRSDLAGEKRKI